MNWLDENFPDDQRAILVRWGIHHRRIGREVAWAGAQDSDLIPLLQSTSGVTFFTLDEDFFQRRFCHRAYCLVWLDVAADDAAEYVRRLLRDPRFRTRNQRLGAVIRAHHDGLACWRTGLADVQRLPWSGT